MGKRAEPAITLGNGCCCSLDALQVSCASCSLFYSFLLGGYSTCCSVGGQQHQQLAVVLEPTGMQTLACYLCIQLLREVLRPAQVTGSPEMDPVCSLKT